MSRTKFFLSNSAAMGLQYVVALAAALIIPRLIIVTYGSDINGLIVSVTQFAAYFLLVEAGISGAAVYALYKPLALGDAAKINGILSAAKRFYFQSGWIFTALVAALAILYPLFTKELSLTFAQTAIIVCAVGMGGVLDFFAMAKYRVLLTADQRTYVLCAASLLGWTVNIALVVLFAAFKWDIVTLQVCLILSVFLRVLILHFYTKTHYNYLDYTAPPDNSALNERWSVLYQQILGGVQTSMPVIIATIFTSLAQVSVYAVYNLVVAGISSLLNIFTSGLGASFGQVIALKQRGVLKKANQEFELFYYMLITIVYSVALLMMLPFIKIYTSGITDINYYSVALAFLFVTNGLLFNLKTPQGMLIFSAGMYRQTRVQTTIQAAVALLGAIIFVQFWGLAGILAGFILSNIYRDIDVMLFVPKNITRLSYKRTMHKILRVLFTYALAAFVFFKAPISCHSVLEWILYAAGLTIAISVWVIGLNAVFDYKIMKAALKRLKNLFIKRAGDRSKK